MTNDKAPYGYCPICGAPGVMRERSPWGNTHSYPSSTSVGETSSCEAKIPTPKLDLDAIEARVQKATKAADFVPPFSGFPLSVKVHMTCDRGNSYSIQDKSGSPILPKLNVHPDILALFAASFTDIPALIARVRELEGELSNLGSACDKIRLAERQANKKADVMARAMEWWRNVARGTPRPPISRTTIARFLALVEAEHRIADLEDDNAAIRLAATELYELVVDASKSAGIDPSYGPSRNPVPAYVFEGRK